MKTGSSTNDNMLSQCPLCASRQTEHLYLIDKGDVLRCAGCGIAFLDRGADIYDIAHYDYYQEKMSLSSDRLYTDLNENRYRDILARVERYRKNNTLLDIGCGAGHFVKTAKAVGWSAEGIEVAPYAVEICRKNKIPVIEADLLTYERPEHYDVVSLLEVIEHLTNPEKYIEKARQVLCKGGCMILTTPNFNSITRRMIGDKWRAINSEHLFYFTPKALCNFISKNGFRIRECDVRNIEPHEILKFFKPRSPENRARDQELRGAIEKSAFLRWAKRSTNALLNMTKLGESIFIIAEKA